MAMKQKCLLLAGLLYALLVVPLHAADTMTPGLYEYTVRMSGAGVPANVAPQTFRQCMTPEDISSKRNYVPGNQNTDCQVKDRKESGGTFAYAIACTKPQKWDGTVTGSFTATSMSMNMTM